YDRLIGEGWPYDQIMKHKQDIEEHRFCFNVIESVPVHEDIKMGIESRDKWIDNYKQTLRNLSKAGIKTVCYNFMPVFDWTRSQLDAPLPDGSNSLSYDNDLVQELNPLEGGLELPGWDLSYQTDDLKKIMDQYQHISESQLMNNLIYFLEEIVPVAEEEDILLAIHPDDPPWSIFGLPRVVTGKRNVEYLLQAVDSPNNGITFCMGAYASHPDNNLTEIIEAAKDRIHFVHARNIKQTGTLSFQETCHLAKDGSIDMVRVMKKLVENGFAGSIRPDHGRMI